MHTICAKSTQVIVNSIRCKCKITQCVENFKYQLWIPLELQFLAAYIRSDVGSDIGSDVRSVVELVVRSVHFGHLGISFLTSFNQQLFRNIAYVWYPWHFNKAVCVCLYLCIYICICVFVFLTVGNISFDVLGLWAFQKYSTIRFSKIFWAWWRPNKQPGEPSASLLVEHWAK